MAERIAGKLGKVLTEEASISNAQLTEALQI